MAEIPLAHWSIGPLVECQMSNVICQMTNVKNQMSNVNKVNFLSERISGVPPVIFLLQLNELVSVSNSPGAE